MKTTTLIIALLLPAFYLAAQTTVTTDTTFRYNNRSVVVNEKNNEINVSVYRLNAQGDTIKSEKMYEGIFTDNREIERSYENSFEITIPILKSKSKRKKNTSHWAGIGFGRPYFSDDLKDAVRVNRSIQWNINAIETSINLWNTGLTFISGLGYQINNIRLQPNTIIRNIDNVSVISHTNVDEDYSRTNMHYSAFTVSILLEGNFRLNHRQRLFINGGIVSKINTKTELNTIIDGKRTKLTRDINIFGEGVDLLVQAGVNHIGFFASHSLTPVFEFNKGTKGRQTTIGLQFYF